MSVLASAGDNAQAPQAGRRGGVKGGNETSCFKIVKMIMERNFAPVIIFSFSKKDCELYAMQMAKLDFNNLEEKKLVDEVFNNAMDVLSEDDRMLPQVENVLPLLRRGIGIHHGGNFAADYWNYYQLMFLFTSNQLDYFLCVPKVYCLF